jgi:hypothetical protein
VIDVANRSAVLIGGGRRPNWLRRRPDRRLVDAAAPGLTLSGGVASSARTSSASGAATSRRARRPTIDRTSHSAPLLDQTWHRCDHLPSVRRDDGWGRRGPASGVFKTGAVTIGSSFGVPVKRSGLQARRVDHYQADTVTQTIDGRCRRRRRDRHSGLDRSTGSSDGRLGILCRRGRRDVVEAAVCLLRGSRDGEAQRHGPRPRPERARRSHDVSARGRPNLSRPHLHRELPQVVAG